MKKVVLASLLAVAGAASVALPAIGQTAPAPVNLGTGAAKPATATQAAAGAAAGPCAAPASTAVNLGTQANGQVQMSADEYASYNNATTQTTPATRATAFEAYLKAYPNSAVKADALQQLMFAYSGANDAAKTLDAADRLLAVDPCNFRALVFEVSLHRAASDAATDAAAKQSGYDAAADFANRGLAAPKPKDMSDADFTTLKSQGYPIFYSAIGTAALNKKDTATAIKNFTLELTTVPLQATTTPGLQLQDTFYLAQAYYTSTPPDYLNCAYYAGRAMNYAPEPYKTTFKQLATYCYHKYHGPGDDGFDAMVAVAAANLTPPSTLNVKAAPKPEDIVSNLIATTPDLATLALSDKEYVLQNGKKADADKVFDTIKGKSVEIPDALVTVASADGTQVQVAVSEDSVQAKTADFTFNFTTPLTKIPAVGDKISLQGTYASYTQSPLMITMSDGSVVEKKKTAPKTTPKAPVHHTTHK